MGAAAVVAVVLGLGPFRSQTGRQITNLRQRIMPKPTYIDGQVALAGPNNAPVPRLTDKLVGTGEFSSTQVGAGPPASTDPPVFSVKVGTDGDLNRPIDLYKVGIITGLIGEQPAKHPAPHHVLLVAYDHAGHQEKAKTIDLHDTSAFQSFTFATSKVSRVDFYVVDTYSSPDRQGPYIIDEVELFTR